MWSTECQISDQIMPNWHQLGQIWDFLRQIFFAVIEPTCFEQYLSTIFKGYFDNSLVMLDCSSGDTTGICQYNCAKLAPIGINLGLF